MNLYAHDFVQHSGVLWNKREKTFVVVVLLNVLVMMSAIRVCVFASHVRGGALHNANASYMNVAMPGTVYRSTTMQAKLRFACGNWR